MREWRGMTGVSVTRNCIDIALQQEEVDCIESGNSIYHHESLAVHCAAAPIRFATPLLASQCKGK